MELRIFRHRDETRPGLFARKAEDFDDFHHLVALEGDGLFAVHFRFFAFEDWAEGEQFCEYAAYGPHVDCGCVVSTSEEEFWCSVPDCDDYFVAGEERVERFVEESG